MADLIIENTYPKSDTSPMLVNFQTGFLDDNFTSHDKCLLLKNVEKECRSAVIELENTVYLGDENEDPFERTMLLARNKRTGKVRLIEVGSCLVKAVISQDVQVEIKHQVDALEMSRKFGSKKQKQVMEQKAKLNATVEAVAEQMKEIEEETDNIPSLDTSAFNKTNTEDAYIPPINREAGDVREVYSLKDLLSDEQVEKVTGEIESKEYTEELVPYMKSFVSTNFISFNKELTPTEIGLVLYANSLLKIYGEMAKEIVKKNFIVCSCSNTIHELVMSNFTLLSNNKRTRPGPMKDKALCYALIILLVLNDFKIQLEPLSMALKLSPASVGLKARTVGAGVVTQKNKKYIQLKLPLNIASINRRKSAKF